MDTTSSTTTNTTASAARTRRRSARERVRPLAGAHDIAVQIGAWGPQVVHVAASSGGGRDGKPYIVVRVGECLTYVYDREALGCIVAAWREAAQMNRAVRLGELAPSPEQQDASAAGQDFAVVCNVMREQHTAVHATGSTGRPVLTVVVGAVTTRVHTTTALTCHLDAWTRAETIRNILEPER